MNLFLISSNFAYVISWILVANSEESSGSSKGGPVKGTTPLQSGWTPPPPFYAYKPNMDTPCSAPAITYTQNQCLAASLKKKIHKDLRLIVGNISPPPTSESN